MNRTDLKLLIKECIKETNLNEGIGDFLSGGITGFVAGWVMKKPKGKKEKLQAIKAASNYQNAITNLKDALEEFSGDTPEEKYQNFLNTLNDISKNELTSTTRVKAKPMKIRMK
jgi:hypothetical protein